MCLRFQSERVFLFCPPPFADALLARTEEGEGEGDGDGGEEGRDGVIASALDVDELIELMR